MVVLQKEKDQKAPFQKTRSLLFVPASRPDRFSKALSSGADIIVIDLEDAVAPAEKETARASLKQFLDRHPAIAVMVRINAAGTKEFALDLQLCHQQPGVAAIMLAKSQSVDALQWVVSGNKPVWPLVETALGIDELPRMAKVKGVERFCFGALDLAVDLRLKPDTAGARMVLDRVRCELLLQSRIAGLAGPVESVYPAIDDEQQLTRLARQASEMGFSGMLCIHPRQLAPIHRGFQPEQAELDWAKQVIATAEKGEGVFTVNGRMVDAPVIQQARLIVSQAMAPLL